MEKSGSATRSSQNDQHQGCEPVQMRTTANSLTLCVAHPSETDSVQRHSLTLESLSPQVDPQRLLFPQLENTLIPLLGKYGIHH